MNGQRNRANNFLLDGTDNNDQFTAGRVAVNPNVDMVQEFRVSSNNFSAEFGRNSASVVNVVTKQGTNALHGTALRVPAQRRDGRARPCSPPQEIRSSSTSSAARSAARSDGQDVLLRSLRRPAPDARRHARAHRRDAGVPAAGRAALSELDRATSCSRTSRRRRRPATSATSGRPVAGPGQRQLAQHAGRRRPIRTTR